MNSDQFAAIRRFNRLHTQRIGALHNDYLDRGRPLSEARLLYEIGTEGAEVKELRKRLGLDSGYMSRLLRSTEQQKLVWIEASNADRRIRMVRLTSKGEREREAYEKLSDELARSMLSRLTIDERSQLVSALKQAARLLMKGEIELRQDDPEGSVAQNCHGRYYKELQNRFETGFDPFEKSYAGVKSATETHTYFVAAWLSGEAAGCGSLVWSEEQIGEVKRMWVAASARGLGIASEILRHLEITAKANGVTYLRLDTNRALEEAQALYRSAGFVPIARYSDNPYAHHWFGKKL